MAGGIHRPRDVERAAGVERDVAGNARQDPQHVSQNGRVVTVPKTEPAGPGEPCGIERSIGDGCPVCRRLAGALAVVPGVGVIHERRGGELSEGRGGREEGE